VWLMGIVVGIATFASIGIYWIHDPAQLPLVKALLWIFIPAIYFYIGPCFGLLNNLAMPRMRAMFCAATLFVANVGNLIVAPLYVGSLSNWFDPLHQGTAESLRLALLCLTPVGSGPPSTTSGRHVASCRTRPVPPASAPSELSRARVPT